MSHDIEFLKSVEKTTTYKMLINRNAEFLDSYINGNLMAMKSLATSAYKNTPSAKHTVEKHKEMIRIARALLRVKHGK